MLAIAPAPRKAPKWLMETPEELGSFGLVMFSGPECTEDYLQEVEIFRSEFIWLKMKLAQHRGLIDEDGCATDAQPKSATP